MNTSFGRFILLTLFAVILISQDRFSSQAAHYVSDEYDILLPLITTPDRNYDIVASGRASNLYAVLYGFEISTGSVTMLTSPADYSYLHSWSPDGSQIVFSYDTTGGTRLAVMNRDGSERTELDTGGSDELWPRWSPTGDRIAFCSARTGSFELYVSEADGSNPIRLTDGYGEHQGCSKSEWSPDGTHLLFSQNLGDRHDILIVDVNSKEITNLTDNPARDNGPSWSPNGQQICYTRSVDYGVEADVFLMNADGSSPVNLTNHPSIDASCEWSPDGSQIAFHSRRDGNGEIYLMNSDGSNPHNLTETYDAYEGGPSWSPYGTKIAFSSGPLSMNPRLFDIHVMNADGSRRVNLSNNPTEWLSLEWSPVSPY